MTIQEHDGKWSILHAGKVIKQKFDTEGEAWRWADANIDDQMFDDPNSFLPSLVYEDGNEN